MVRIMMPLLLLEAAAVMKVVVMYAINSVIPYNVASLIPNRVCSSSRSRRRRCCCWKDERTLQLVAAAAAFEASMRMWSTGMRHGMLAKPAKESCVKGSSSSACSSSSSSGSKKESSPSTPFNDNSNVDNNRIPYRG